MYSKYMGKTQRFWLHFCDCCCALTLLYIIVLKLTSVVKLWLLLSSLWLPVLTLTIVGSLRLYVMCVNWDKLASLGTRLAVSTSCGCNQVSTRWEYLRQVKPDHSSAIPPSSTVEFNSTSSHCGLPLQYWPDSSQESYTVVIAVVHQCCHIIILRL